jgi:hypothetical protein
MWKIARTHNPSPNSQCALFLGIYESDDISDIISEIEKAINYSQKVSFGLEPNTCTGFYINVLGPP